MKINIRNALRAIIIMVGCQTSLWAQQIQWCAVTSFGQVVYCFPTKEACTAMKIDGQTCVAMPTGK